MMKREQRFGLMRAKVGASKGNTLAGQIVVWPAPFPFHTRRFVVLHHRHVTVYAWPALTLNNYAARRLVVLSRAVFRKT